MGPARMGMALQILGILGLVAMLAATGVTIQQTRNIDDRANDVLLPVTGGLDSLDAQLATVSQLWADIIEALPAESTADLSGTIAELAAGLERADGLIETARGGLDALDGIPFLPVDTGDMRAQLVGLEESLDVVTPLVEEVNAFLAANEGAPGEIVEGVSAGLEQLGAGLDAAKTEVASISDAVDRWLVGGTVVTLVLLALSLVGQIGLVALGRQMRRTDQLAAVAI